MSNMSNNNNNRIGGDNSSTCQNHTGPPVDDGFCINTTTKSHIPSYAVDAANKGRS